MSNYNSIHTGSVIDGAITRVVDNEDYTLVEKNKLSGIESGAQVNTVTSVANKTGDVTLEADDVNDTLSTNKFTTQADIDRLADTSGTNTGDQDLSGYFDTATNTIDDILDGATYVKILETERDYVNNLQSFIETEATGDDAGVKIIGGQFSVGESTSPYESTFGGGDSIPVDVAYQYNTTNESGTTITSATDVSTILQSDSDSSVVMWEDNLAGDVLLLGADFKFYGVKVKYDTLGAVEPENIYTQYLNNLSAWTDAQRMSKNANGQHESCGWNISQNISEQINFQMDVVDPETTDWEQVTLSINGSDVTKYWARVLLISPITLNPVVQQIKQHTDRFEVNSNGTTEFYGTSRSIFVLQEGIRNLISNANSSPASQNVGYFTSGVSGTDVLASYSVNRLANNAIDAFIIEQSVVRELDTSIPLLLEISFYVDGTGTGDIEFQVELVVVNDGYIYNASGTPDKTISVIKTISASQDNVRDTVQIELPVQEVDCSGGAYIFNIVRDGTASNADDTLSENIIITNYILYGRRHIV